MNRKQCESLYPDKELLSEEEQKNISGLVDNYLKNRPKLERLRFLRKNKTSLFR